MYSAVHLRPNAMPRNQPPRVSILVDTSTGWGRRLIRGIAGYARKHGPWHLWVEGRGQDEPLRLPPGWVGEGIIARISDRAIARHLAAAGVPVVNISSIALKGIDFPRVATDLHAAGHMAAEYFLNRGLRNFAYVGLPRLSWVRQQYQGFSDRLKHAGHACSAHAPGPGITGSSGWLPQQRDLIRWLRELPKPVGILAWATRRGRELLDACRWAELLVPEQVAILGGDDDELLCEACSPSLSGLAVASEQIGHAAAELLDRLMRGVRPPQKPSLFPPAGVITRQSTETLAIEDADLARAIRYLREHAPEPITVDNVLREVPISRRKLERNFRRVLGRSPAEELRRLRLERAKELLARTDMPIPRVAAASGFGSPEYLAGVLKKDTGLTPLKYRSLARGR